MLKINERHTMKKVVIEEKYLNRVQISKDEISNYDEVKNLPNANIYREGTADEYVVFNTIDLTKVTNYKAPKKSKSKKINSIFKVKQLNSQGGFCCNLGFFESREIAIEKTFKGLSKDYKGFRKEVWFDGKNQWHCDKYEFIIDISEIEFNTYGEV